MEGLAGDMGLGAVALRPDYLGPAALCFVLNHSHSIRYVRQRL